MLIAQLSDIHVRPRGQLYKGVVDSNALLAQAIAHLHALDRAPDLVLISGDLVDEGQPEEYAMAAELLHTLQLPYRLMPGNHDHRAPFLATFGATHPYLPAHGPLHYCVDDFPVRIVALDSCPPGEHHGHIDSDGLRWLQHTLSADPLKPTIVLLHHPPFESGISYLDDYRYIDAEPLAAVIRQFQHIEAVLCGHVHRTMVRRWAGTVVVACPSTATEIALQLAPGAVPQSFLGPPACLLHLWNPQQGLVSHVSYTGRYPGPYPFS
ncbi:MAG: phosphodiesterase [Acidovorax sp.]|uniref:phosphodiesterase n=1 Tax=Acidovorax sp. TaxID=1872122 RepID=UPI0039195089